LPASLSTAQDLLARLVAFDTTSAKSNLELIAFVEDYLKGEGIASTRVPSPDGAKADLFATIGAPRDGGVGLSGHSDCVPVEGRRDRRRADRDEGDRHP
jgi:acetylornithine deacetylase